MEELNKKDATGAEIVIGKTYGYSSSNNGYSLVRIGMAINITDKGFLKLHLIRKSRARYMNEAKSEEIYQPFIMVKPSMLFPVVWP